jgi:hypothetical protein
MPEPVTSLDKRISIRPRPATSLLSAILQRMLPSQFPFGSNELHTAHMRSYLYLLLEANGESLGRAQTAKTAAANRS